MGDVPLSDSEQLVLLAVVRLGEGACGITVHREMEKRKGRSASVTATYAALKRMEQRGFATSSIGEAAPVRGGRAKKHFEVTPEGALAPLQILHVE